MKPKRHEARPESRGGHRGEIFSQSLYNKSGLTYFLNLKENREGDIYLNIVESKRKSEGSTAQSFRRHSILIFPEQRDQFARSCLQALEALSAHQPYKETVDCGKRNFTFEITQKRAEPNLIIREKTSERGDQIILSAGSAEPFSQVLVKTLDFWLKREENSPKPDGEFSQRRNAPRQ